MSEIIFDIETNGTNPSIIWCISAKPLVPYWGDWNKLFVGEDILKFPKWLEEEECKTLIGHNIIGYDLPVLKRLMNFDWKGEVKDTLVISRLSNPSREEGHSLKSWGEQLGYLKLGYEDWTKYTKEMGEYCIKDVEISKRVYLLLRNRVGKEALDLEQKVHKICSSQTRVGWKFNLRKATNLMAILKEEIFKVEEEVRSVFVPLKDFLELKELKIKHKKDDSRSKAYQNQLDKGAYRNTEGIWGMDYWPEFNLGSRIQIAKHLKHYGWEPKEFTPTGRALVNEKVLDDIEIPQAKLINRFLMLQKRIAMLTNWMSALGVDERIHGYVNSCGAVTGRMTHSSPNLAQVPANYSAYGRECRELFIVEPAYKLVGMDASGLELRMLAHYLNDSNYTREILEGDIHTANQQMAGLQSRDQAKTFIYAFLYGAGDSKIGEVVGGSAKEGKALKKAFLKNNPALKTLRENIIGESRQGFIKGLDGRKIWIRSEHAALNTLLQSAGAIVMKQALVLLDEHATRHELNFKFVGNIHDEIQAEVLTQNVHSYGALAVKCLKLAGEHFKLNCPLDGEYKVGNNWAETH